MWFNIIYNKIYQIVYLDLRSIEKMKRTEYYNFALVHCNTSKNIVLGAKNSIV